MASDDAYKIFATNSSSLFKPFSLTLPNTATLTGIAHIPTSGHFHSSSHKPLLIGIHGGSCSAHTWDASPQYTASTYSSLTGIPFVAFHRPNYLGTSGWLRSTDTFKAPEERSYFEQEARWLHEFILPALWETYGVPNGCQSIVSDSHSMAGPVTVIAAGYYSQTPPEERTYPWAGMVISGIGEEPLQTSLDATKKMLAPEWTPTDLPLGHEEGVHFGPFTKEDKIALMLGPPGCCDDSLGDLCWTQNTPFLLAEIVSLNGVWKERKNPFKALVEIPVLYGIGTMEWLWKYERRHVEMFTGGFVKAPRVEGAVIRGAPHAVEWSPLAGGWWLRVMGWAVEVSTSLGVEGRGVREYE